MKPDLLICWIKHTDYPIFRMLLERHRKFFDKVIIYWSEHFRHIYFDKFIEEALSHLDITFLPNIEYQYGKEDWRNVATHHMLKHSTNEWVCSIEQDWFAKDYSGLLEAVQKSAADADLIGWWQENNDYIHPSFWFIKRSVLEQTTKDFAAHDEHDHFGWITHDVKKLGKKIVTTKQLGYKDFEDTFHLGGINQNYLNGLDEGFVFHRPDIFYVYNYFCRQTPVKQDPRFIDLSQEIENKLALPINPTESQWAPFFI